MNGRRYAAVDLGASSGRVITAAVGESTVEFTEVHRFANTPVQLGGALHWDVHGLYRQIRAGLEAAGAVRSVGIDSWAVDYGLLDEHGELLEIPYHYRDRRASDLPEWPDPQALYRTTGIAELPFNTIHQLRAESVPRLASAHRLLMIPDLFAYWLTGEMYGEHTNASTTQLYDVHARNWSPELAKAVGAPEQLFPELRAPGDPIGVTDLGPRLIAVASHDTASAVAAVPAVGDRFAYISCGTWSLVGVELAAPILSAESRRAGFTNETGVDGTIRYLRNVTGLFVLQECLREWSAPPLAPLLAAAEEVPPLRSVVDPDRFHLPGNMPERIAAECARTGQHVPDTRAELVRCVLDSLALGHRRALRDAIRLSGRDVDVVHMVGGGARNSLLCQLTADACGRPVLAGPVEATAMGNVLIQARADGLLTDLAEMRAMARASKLPRTYEPQGVEDAWLEADKRLHGGVT